MQNHVQRVWKEEKSTGRGGELYDVGKNSVQKKMQMDLTDEEKQDEMCDIQLVISDVYGLSAQQGLVS